MPTKDFDFEITVPITRFEESGWSDVILLPVETEKQLPFNKSSRLRIDGVLNAVPLKAAWQPRILQGKRRYFISVSKRLQREGDFGLGDEVTLRFRLDDPDAVDMPIELALAFHQNQAAAAIWAKFTPGGQRGLCHHVATAASLESRIHRASDITEKMLKGELWAQRAQKTKKAQKPKR